MAVNEGLVLGGLDLHDDVSYVIEALDLGNPTKRLEWATGADADGALLVRDPLVENRIITARIRVVPQSTMTAALDKVAAVSKKLEEAEQQTDGLDLVWTPANTTTKALTFYVLSGQIDGLPIDPAGADAGYFVRAPVFTVRMTCRPFGYEPEVLYGTSTTSSGILPTLVVSGVPGDVPAEARLVVTDLATQDRHHLEWGLEWRSYNAATSLEIDSDNMVTTGLNGTQSTRTGAYDPGAVGNNVIRGFLVSTPSAICGTGHLGHVGTYRVKLRCWPTSTSVQVRLAWRDGDGTYIRNMYQRASVPGAWNDLDLGLVSISVAQSGTQTWQAAIEAFSPIGGDSLDVDVLMMIPAAEGYGKARATYDNTVPTAYSATDAFDQAAGALTAQALPLGGTWAGAGNANDFSVNAASHTAQRTAVSDGGGNIASGRLMTASLPVLVNTVVSIDMDMVSAVSAVPFGGVLARYVDASNFVAARYAPAAGGTSAMYVEKIIAGVATRLALADVNGSVVPVTLRLSITPDGYYSCDCLSGGVAIATTTGYDSALASGGTLATGKVGFFDYQQTGTASTRIYDNFIASSPGVDAVVFSGRSGEFRSDGAIRQDPTGTYYGRMQTYRGSRFMLPPAGDQNRASRIAVKARRNDVDVARDDQIADSTKLEVYYRARHAVVRTT